MNSILHSHSSTPATAQQHLNNMSASLARRIEVARTNNNHALLSQLQKERQILEEAGYATGSRSKLGGLQQFFRQVVTAMQNADKLHVEKIVNESGETWWYAHDPRTDKTLWSDTQSEVVKWIEDNNLGR